MSGQLYVSAGFVHETDNPPRVRITRPESGTRVHVDIGELTLVVTRDTARELRDALIADDLGDAS